MEAINYILGLAIIFAGFAAGLILGRIAREELGLGRKYLLIFQNFLISAIFVIGAFSIQSTALRIILSAVLLYLVVFDYAFNWIIAYASFTAIYLLVPDSLNLIILLSSLMFLYGFPTGSLIAGKKRWF